MFLPSAGKRGKEFRGESEKYHDFFLLDVILILEKTRIYPLEKIVIIVRRRNSRIFNIFFTVVEIVNFLTNS